MSRLQPVSANYGCLLARTKYELVPPDSYLPSWTSRIIKRG
jgi:hypothetical protein